MAETAAMDLDVPQSVPLDDRQVQCNAGGFVYTVDDFTRLRRFLVLGTDGVHYYVTKQELKYENASCVMRLLDGGNGAKVVEEVVEISSQGRAPKQGPGIFVLAMCARLGDEATRQAALAAVPRVCRTASTLFEFVQRCKELGTVAQAAAGVETPAAKPSWGRAMRRAVAQWYLSKDPAAVAYQVTKYSQRSGWSHTDLLRLAHPDVDATAAKRFKEGGEANGAAVQAAPPAATAAGGEEDDEEGDAGLPPFAAATGTADGSTADGGRSPAAVWADDMKAIFAYLTQGSLPGQGAAAAGATAAGRNKGLKRKSSKPADGEVDAPAKAAAAAAADASSVDAATAAVATLEVDAPAKAAAAADASSVDAATAAVATLEVDPPAEAAADGAEAAGGAAAAAEAKAEAPPEVVAAAADGSTDAAPAAVAVVQLSPVMQYILDADYLRKTLKAPPPYKVPKPAKADEKKGEEEGGAEKKSKEGSEQGSAEEVVEGSKEVEMEGEAAAASSAAVPPPQDAAAEAQAAAEGQEDVAMGGTAEAEAGGAAEPPPAPQEAAAAGAAAAGFAAVKKPQRKHRRGGKAARGRAAARGGGRGGGRPMRSSTVGADAAQAEAAAGMEVEEAPEVVEGRARVAAATAAAVQEACALVRKHRFGWEHVGDSTLLKSPDLWTTFLECGLPMTAMLRNLGRMTSYGVLGVQANVDAVTRAFRNANAVRKARLHPITLLSAMRTYGNGRGAMGGLSWEPVKEVVDALEDAYYLAFDNVEPTGKRYLAGIDISGSMGGAQCAGMKELTARDAAAAMAMAFVRTEPSLVSMAFCDEFERVNLTKTDRLDAVIDNMVKLSHRMGGTDCAAPMLYALKERIAVDVFLVFTDNETWHGTVHPTAALKKYREEMGLPEARLIVFGFSATEFTIADPSDPLMMDVAGIDAAVPRLVAEFVNGKV